MLSHVRDRLTGYFRPTRLLKSMQALARDCPQSVARGHKSPDGLGNVGDSNQSIVLEPEKSVFGTGVDRPSVQGNGRKRLRGGYLPTDFLQIDRVRNWPPGLRLFGSIQRLGHAGECGCRDRESKCHVENVRHRWDDPFELNCVMQYVTFVAGFSRAIRDLLVETATCGERSIIQPSGMESAGLINVSRRMHSPLK